MAEVTPNNATEKGYTLTSSDPELVDVTKDGVIVPKKEGTAEITAKSNDKSFTDTMSVVVVSSKPYDFDFTLLGEDGENLLTETDEGYDATLPTGTYTYGMDIYPLEYTEYKLEPTGEAEVERGTKSLYLPFSGDTELAVTVPNGVRGEIRKNVTLHVIKTAETSVVVNGAELYDGTSVQAGSFDGLKLAAGATEARLYVECPGRPTFESEYATAHVTGSGGRYILDLTILPGAGEGFSAILRAGGKQFDFMVSFTAFTFSVCSDRTIETAEDGTKKITLLTGNAASFYTVASAGARDVAYSWTFSGPKEYLAETDSGVTVKAAKGGTFTLSVTAKYGTHEPITEEITLEIINKISVVQIANNTKADLAQSYTVAGMAYGTDLSVKGNRYPLRVYTFTTAGIVAAGEDIVYSVDNAAVAAVETTDGASPVLVPKSSGKVTVTAAWKGNAAFKANVVATLSVSVVMDAVAVTNAPELTKAMEEKRPAVLMENIKLGTNAAGADFSQGERMEYLRNHRMKSTYNIEWYKHATDGSKESDAYLSYVLEFTANVYGNGKSIDADNFTHALDNTGKPLLAGLYDGPRYFVKYQQMASVAGQDNCAFLIRTDGIKLYGVNLLGCSDDSLLSAEGQYDLTNLNLTGTTLEINADCEIVNCRIRNGRNVVRAYGGNRDGNAYFVDSLAGSALAAADHIDVKIEGCILAQGREFILKMGANRALRASKTNRQDPVLRGQNAAAYPEEGRSNRYGELYKDEWFYAHYVMTDLTLKDSVLETSGLFTVGIESNFAGEFLFDGATDHQWRAFTREWEYSGGTSFASVLRLVGDVRLYDWKDLALIDSSTLIESPVGALSEWLKLDIKSMLNYVSTKDPADYGNVIETTSDGKQYVHGGIALYGGGRNYSAVEMSALKAYDGAVLNDFLHINVNIDVLKDAGATMQKQGDLLPRAAGTHDFNFYMYGKNSTNNYLKQRADEQRGVKYLGVTSFPLF